MANNKKRYLTFEIYPDNPEQIKVLEWLKTANVNSGMYILHKGENGGKDHYHVLIYEDYPINCKKQGETFVATSYARRFGSFEGLLDGDKMLYKCRDELPPGKSWETFPIIGQVQGVSDVSSLAHYFLHERYCDIREGKTLYQFTDLKYWGDSERFKRLFNTDKNNDDNIMARAVLVGSGCTTSKQFVKKCLEIADWELLEFIRKNPYFVTKFIVGD